MPTYIIALKSEKNIDRVKSDEMFLIIDNRKMGLNRIILNSSSLSVCQISQNQPKIIKNRYVQRLVI